MSFFSDALSNALGLPAVGGIVPNTQAMLTGLGAPLIGAPKTPTEQQQEAIKQVGEKIDYGMKGDDAGYLRSIYEKPWKGFKDDPNAYKGIPTAEKQASQFQSALRRQAESNANRNAFIGARGIRGGADAARLETEAALQGQGQLADIASRNAWEEYQSKVNEMEKNAAARDALGIRNVQRQLESTRQVREGAPGEIAGVFSDIASAASGGGAIPLMQRGQKYTEAVVNPFLQRQAGSNAASNFRTAIDPLRAGNEYFNKQKGA